jgi:hypothetical protein
VDTTARPERDTRRGHLTRLPDPPAPRVPDLARRLTERAFAALARRGGRAFHPWNTASALVPVGPLNHLRAPAYEASQRTATSE